MASHGAREGRAASIQVHRVERDMFAASTMAAGADVAFEQMKLPQLKEELAARDAKRAGMKAVLQMYTHAQLQTYSATHEPSPPDLPSFG